MTINCFKISRLVIFILLEVYVAVGSVGSIAARTSRKLETRVVGGTVANAQRYPYFTMLRFYNGEHTSVWICGGSLITPEVVLTNSACMSGATGVDAWVNSTSHDHNDATKTEYFRKGRLRVQHPNFNSMLRFHDIGLVFLDKPVKNVPLLQLNRDDSFPDDTSQVTLTVMGLGEIARTTIWEPEVFPEHLMFASMNVMPPTECYKYWNSALITESQLCASGDGQRGICWSDMGGPIILDGGVAKRDKQIGIASLRLEECAAPHTADVFTKVSPYIEWIEEQECLHSLRTPSWCE